MTAETSTETETTPPEATGAAESDATTEPGHGTGESPADAPEAEATAGADEAEQDAEDEGGNREAARYRRRLREAEAERDGLSEQLSALQAQVAESIAESEARIRPSALWASGATVAGLVAEDGTVDREAVLAACNAAVSTLGLARTPKPDPNQGRDAAPPQSGDQMAAAIAGN